MDARGPLAVKYKYGSLRGVIDVFRAVYQIDVHYALKLLSDIVYIRGGGQMRVKIVDCVDTAAVVSALRMWSWRKEVGWLHHTTGDGNEHGMSMEQAIRGQNKGTTITVYPDRLTLRDTADKRKHSRLQHQIETVKLGVSVFSPPLFFFFLSSGFRSQG